MPRESPSAKRVRKGTRSCTECRRRKVRCIWPTTTADICEFCRVRGLRCEQQVVHTPAADVVRATTRARLAHLERNVSSIWSALCAVEEKTGCKVSHPRLVLQPESSVNDEVESRDGSDSDTSDDVPAHTAPTHLLQLFDNSLLDSRNESSIAGSESSFQATTQQDAHDSHALLKLMPSREQMVVISAQASSWLSLYAALFPTVDAIGTGEQMLARYDELLHTNADPIAVAALLLSIALTVQQAPTAISNHTGRRFKDADSFIKEVSDMVDRIVICNDTRAGSVAGIQTAMLFLRLQLGRARLRKVWLLVRRIVALAELVGLPRAAMILRLQPSPPHANDLPAERAPLQHKAELWESICAIDRIISMMWSLPLGTAGFTLPKRPILDAAGGVIIQSFLYKLADIASQVQELEDISSPDNSLREVSSVVVRIDHELRALGSLPQRIWWSTGGTQSIVEGLMQYWYQYITVRAHLRLALAYGSANQHLAANFVACRAAAEELARRYVAIRPIVPSGFFANWVIDVQAFTGTVFLLLSGHRADHSAAAYAHSDNRPNHTAVIDQVTQVMASTTGQTGRTFAHQAAKVIRSLESLLQQPQASRGRDISLSLPLVGKIRVSCKSRTQDLVGDEAAPDRSQQPDAHGPTFQTGEVPPMSETSVLDSFSYSMEFPESYLFLTDDIFADQQWLTWSG